MPNTVFLGWYSRFSENVAALTSVESNYVFEKFYSSREQVINLFRPLYMYIYVYIYVCSFSRYSVKNLIATACSDILMGRFRFVISQLLRNRKAQYYNIWDI